jgi:hypothetical protein
MLAGIDVRDEYFMIIYLANKIEPRKDAMNMYIRLLLNQAMWASMMQIFFHIAIVFRSHEKHCGPICVVFVVISSR